MKNKFGIVVGVVIIAVVVIIALAARNGSPKEEISYSKADLDIFAQCLTDAGAVFYGAFWCPHCQSQKATFKNSQNIPYVECSTANRQAQTPECIEAGVKNYPTWEFADGSRLGGDLPLSVLAEKTGCELPGTEEEEEVTTEEQVISEE